MIREQATTNIITALPPLSLYIHIPWCVKKCPYCDFNSHTTNKLPEAEYVKALIADLEQEQQYVHGRKLHSIFFGGGTPSLFSAKSIATILTAVEQRIPFESDIEITLEANPGTVEQAKFSGYASAGVNRLSIGVQSFSNSHLQALGRIHNANEALMAGKAAHVAGIHNFNIDLMHGLPNQNQTQAFDDIQQAIDLEPTHISWYQLTIEPNTVFYSSPPVLPNDDRLADIQEAGEQLLADNQFHQYEISAYCRDNNSAKHNINYWQFGDYLGIGAGAHGKLTDSKNNGITRRWKTRVPNDYLKTPFNTAGSKVLSESELPIEFLMNALRLNSGFSKSLFESRTGIAYTEIENRIEKLIQRQLLRSDKQYIQTTDTGRCFLDSILLQF